MKEIYNREEFPIGSSRGLFLAGPTPRQFWVPTWRPLAVKFLKDIGFNGYVIIPEDRGYHVGNCHSWTKELKKEQGRWEREGLRRSGAVVFWIPRKMETMPGLTTNIELGYIFGVDPRKAFVGAPEDAHSVGYIKDFAEEMNVNFYTDLKVMLRAAKEFLNA